MRWSLIALPYLPVIFIQGGIGVALSEQTETIITIVSNWILIQHAVNGMA